MSYIHKHTETPWKRVIWWTPSQGLKHFSLKKQDKPATDFDVVMCVSMWEWSTCL